MSAQTDFDRIPQNATNTETTGSQPNPAVKHPLQNSWTFWYKQPQNQGKQGGDWSKALVEIVKIDTVEDFWALVNNVKDPGSLSNNSSYMLFKSSSKPEWEHSDNAGGYNITLQVPQKFQAMNQKFLNDMWEEILMVLIGEQLGQASEFINGAWVNIRGKGNRFEIWIKKELKPDALKEMVQTLKSILCEAPNLSHAAGSLKLNCAHLGANQTLFEY